MVPWLAEVSWIKIIVFTYMCGYMCVYMNDVNKVYQINGFMVGRSKLDKNNCLYLRMWVCVCVYE